MAYPDKGITHPPLQLKAFAKVHDIAAGGSAITNLKLDKWAFSYWDERRNQWAVEAGRYILHIGFSSKDVVGEVIAIEKSFTWTGL